MHCVNILKPKWVRMPSFSDVVVELAREKNSQRRKDLIKKIQKANEEKRYKIMELVENRKLTRAEFERISLLFRTGF